MRFHSLLAAILLVGSLAGLYSGCQFEHPKADPIPATKNYFRFTFDGQTKEYTNVSLGIGKMGSLSTYDINGSSPDGDLSLTVFGTAAGTFPYRSSPNQYAAVSQVEYKTRGTVFNNYKPLICPSSSGYYATTGQVVATEYVAGKLARGTFSGALLDANDPDDCNKQSKSFNGEFYVTKN